ncbi:hypothetical protein GP486_002841 [Trichoglossum hirsutum]|uniref:Uncharacterized protein n=1 Tax=Trichoglossum hirsutum TaxID=265104 RepID=A0A9P8RRA7_9PEZI|nr:hypothetical protein GP486_002841 [Trichoglossum hirsutum]
MGVDDLFGFSAKSYRIRIKDCSNLDLQRREVTKIRQINGAGFKIGAGVVGALATGGATLIGSGVGARQLNIACRKLAVIRELMQERGLPLHEESKRDMVIPCVASAVGLGVGLGVDVGVGHLVQGAAEQLGQAGVQEAAVHLTMQSTVDGAMTDPSGFAHEFVRGAATNLEQIASLGVAGDVGTNAAVATLPNLIPADSSAGMVVGNVLGQETMANAERAAATALAGSAANCIPVSSRRSRKQKPVRASKDHPHSKSGAGVLRSRAEGTPFASRTDKKEKFTNRPWNHPHSKVGVDAGSKQVARHGALSWPYVGWLILILLIALIVGGQYSPSIGRLRISIVRRTYTVSTGETAKILREIVNSGVKLWSSTGGSESK